MLYSLSSYHLLPQEPGIYLFLDTNGKVLYVGKAKRLRDRVSSYFARSQSLGEKTRLMIAQAHTIQTVLVESELESLLLEAEYIKKYSPKYNIKLTDNKSFQLIKITPQAVYPSVALSRSHGNPEASDTTSAYFGPFPSSKTIKTVLRSLRRIFPYISVENHPKKVCLYHHIGLCPCLPAFDTPENRKDYKKNISHIIDFLHGKKNKVLKELEKERDAASKNENFEKAHKIQQQIDAIHYITSPINKPFEYEINPNLRSDIREKELQELQIMLNEYGVVTKRLQRIECYDNSNIQGYNPVSSMVVFTDGEKDSSEYRRFKVRLLPEGKPNDFVTMEDVIRRRLKHKEWPTPDLIIVDGGKGQISAAQKALEEAGATIPFIGLAKREETIITPDFKEIHLPKNSGALQLVQRLRDEAHRFAITYHRKLRSKTFLTKVVK